MENKKIYQALSNILAEIEAVKKNKNNSQQGFKYRSIDDMFNALHNLFAKNRVFISFNIKEKNTEVLEQNNKFLFKTSLLIEYIFTCEDGSSVSTITYSEALDFGDKGTGKALSYALKYVLMQMFLIPTEDVKDNDAESIEINSKDKKQTKQPVVNKTNNGVSSLPPDVVPMNEAKRIEIIRKINEAQTLDELVQIYNENKFYQDIIKDDLARRKKEITEKQ